MNDPTEGAEQRRAEERKARASAAINHLKSRMEARTRLFDIQKATNIVLAEAANLRLEISYLEQRIADLRHIEHLEQLQKEEVSNG